MSTPISIHQRNYDTEAFDEGDGTLRLVGRLTDTKPNGLGTGDEDALVIHDMLVELVVDATTFEILDVGVTMNVRPYDMCPSVVESYQSLVGVSIARGYSRKVKELFGGPAGCSHVGALLIALGPVAIQASWSMAQRNTDPATWDDLEVDPDEIERRVRLNADTCHVWASDGEQIARLRRGDRQLRPDWQVERLSSLGLL